MRETFSSTDVKGELVATMEQIEAGLSDDTPFCLLLIGDWSGRANRGLFASSAELIGWRPLMVDRDNLDQMMARLGVRLFVPLTTDNSQALTINFNRLDDFHPDRLFKNLEIFERLQQLRGRLENAKTFAEAAKEFRGMLGVSSAAATSEAKAPPSPPVNESSIGPASGAGLLDQILEGTTGESSARHRGISRNVSPEISRLAQAAVTPHLSPAIEEDQDQLLATLDAKISKDMRSILHHTDFQSLEAAWRTIDFLAMRLETSSELKIYLLDISLAELKSDLAPEKELHQSAIYKILVEQTVGSPGGIPWAAIAANYVFDFSQPQPELIERLSLVAQAAGAPFIAGTTSYLLGCQSLSETPDPADWQQAVDPSSEEWWKNLRSMPSSTYVGFVLPRFLVRLPYGKQTQPTEEFDFEELPKEEETPNRFRLIHNSYLWANPAFAIAYVLARGFSESGWSFRPSDYAEIEGLPLHVYERDGQSEIKPCAEVLLTLRGAERIIDRGLMPLLSMKDTDTVRIGMIQSIAGKRLSGRWNGR